MASISKNVQNLDVKKLDASGNSPGYLTGVIVEVSEMTKFSLKGFGLKAVWERIKLTYRRP